MKKRIVLPVLVLSLFLFIISCGIPTIFTFSDANDVLTLKSGSLSFSKDDGVFTGNLMFLYFATDLTGDGLSSVQSSLISNFKSSYIVNSYNSTNIADKGKSPVSTITRTSDGVSKEYKLYQLRVDTNSADNIDCNNQNWASSYMFTLEEGSYSISYSINEDKNLIISIYKDSDDENVFKQAVTLRCDNSVFNFNDTNTVRDYTLATGQDTSNIDLYILPVIVISAPGYNNKLMYVSSDFAAIN